MVDNDIYVRKFDYDTEVFEVTFDGAFNKVLNMVLPIGCTKRSFMRPVLSSGVMIVSFCSI